MKRLLLCGVTAAACLGCQDKRGVPGVETLAQVVLCEQIYRAATLLTGHPYHRD